MIMFCLRCLFRQGVQYKSLESTGEIQVFSNSLGVISMQMTFKNAQLFGDREENKDKNRISLGPSNI